MMNKTLKSLAMLAFAALAVSSCQKENLRENEVTPGKQIEISVNGLMGEYQVADATKADLVNTVRVAWTAGDKVFAYSADGYLGELTASLDESGDDRYAKLSGTITDPGKTITLVYSPLLTSSNKSLLFSDGKLSLNFATQDGAKVPFVVYGTLDVTGSISGKIVPFKFATSVMKVNCTGLSEEEDITKAEVSNVNTVCEITFKDDAAPDIAGKTLGTITRKGDGAFCSADSRAIFQLAIVATEAAQPSERVLTISQDKDYVADFSACALASGKSYNSVYAMAPAPTFKAVYNTTGGANTLTFYYDAEDHSSEGTVYEGSTGDYYLCHDNILANATRWGYNGIRNSIKGVVIDESVAGYHGLTSTGYMFSDFTNTASISGEELLDVSNVTDMRSMFGGVGVSVNPFNEVLNISGWNTSKVQNLNNMFLNYGRNLTNFTLDLSGWDVTNVTTATDMFKQSGYFSTSWSVTIPAKTTLKAGGEKANTASEWYMGDGTTTVAPYGTGAFIILSEGAEGFVDLGVKDADGKPLYWAECNLGASNPQDYGDYFAWGETAPYYTTTGGWPATPTWKSGKDSGYAWQSYCGQSSFDEWSTPPYDATSNILLPAYDAATAANSSWRTPTSDEFKALAASCVWWWTDNYNSTSKAGYIVYKAKNDADKGKANMNGTWKKWNGSSYIDDSVTTESYSTSDTHIFFPAAGSGDGTSLYDAGSVGFCWSSSLNTGDTGYAYGLIFTSDFVSPLSYNGRYSGFSVRPVKAPAPTPTPAVENLVTGYYSYACSNGDEGLLTLSAVDATNYTVSGLGISNGIEWNAVYDKADGTLTMDGTINGHEQDGNMFFYPLGWFNVSEGTVYTLESYGEGSSGKDPIVFDVDTSTGELTAVHPGIYVSYYLEASGEYVDDYNTIEDGATVEFLGDLQTTSVTLARGTSKQSAKPVLLKSSSSNARAHKHSVKNATMTPKFGYWNGLSKAKPTEKKQCAILAK